MWGFFIFGIFQNIIYICIMEYENLRLDVLTKLIDERGISCKNKKDEIIKYLKLDDEGKYIRETTYMKDGNGYAVGIDIKNRDHLLQMSKLIEKKEGKQLNRYEDSRIMFWSPQKLI
jgi:hypothetical protein